MNKQKSTRRKDSKKEESRNRLIGEIGVFFSIGSGLTPLMIQLQESYQKQQSIIFLIIGVILILSASFPWYKAYKMNRAKKMRKILIILAISLVVIGFVGCISYMVSPSLPPENQLLEIFKKHNLNGSIVLALYDKSKGKNNLVKSSDDELKIVVFKKSDNNSIEIIYTPEIDPSGITIISELPEDEYCIGISFFGIILSYIENVNVDHNRVEFIELINTNPQGIIKFEAFDSSNNPLSNIYFEIRSNTEQPLRGAKTGNDGKTLDFWIYSLNEKSIGSYYAVAEIEDSNEIRHEVWRSMPFHPTFKYVGDKYKTKRAVIKLPKN